uniref:Leydig cell tumor 10 kDa protein homolog n=1 Tax=Plectus sambesii TaxID=2011161 RepID=A0A914W3E7_9BILA
MVQHNMKQKVTMPKGVKKKGKKPPKKQGPKLGHGLLIAPKRATLVDQAKTSMAVSRLINKKNEESVGNRANNAVGRDSVAAEKAKKASTSND